MSMKRGNHMKKILSKLQKIEDFILFLTFVIMILGAFAQVLNRNIFKFGISWLEEISRYCMVYMALLATEEGLRDGSQISLTVLTDRLGGTAKTVCHVISKIVVIVFSAVCFYFSFSIIQTQIMSGQVSSGLRVPMWIPYSALPLSFGIITIVQTVTLVLSFFTGKGDDIPEKKEAAE